MRIAFHAPLKEPDHPVASGDRTMARLIVVALAAGGFQPEIACRLRMLDKTGDAVGMALRAQHARDQAADFVRQEQQRPPEDRVAAMVSYHNHYKAPDVFGPKAARALDVPYLLIEASSAPKRATGPWALGHQLAERAIDAADALLWMTLQDREVLARDAVRAGKLVAFPPFLARIAADYAPRPQRHATELLTVAMMRAGEKLASYRQLAAALAMLDRSDWTLTIIGDGPARDEVFALFADFGNQVRFAGPVVDALALEARFATADLLVWPAVGEAYGMVLLEAQAQGCPCLAGNHGGVASVVRDGEGGVLTAPDDIAAFAQALAGLFDDRSRREMLGRTGLARVKRDHGLTSAANILKTTIARLKKQRTVAETKP